MYGVLGRPSAWNLISFRSGASRVRSWVILLTWGGVNRVVEGWSDGVVGSQDAHRCRDERVQDGVAKAEARHRAADGEADERPVDTGSEPGVEQRNGERRHPIDVRLGLLEARLHQVAREAAQLPRDADDVSTLRPGGSVAEAFDP